MQKRSGGHGKAQRTFRVLECPAVILLNRSMARTGEDRFAAGRKARVRESVSLWGDPWRLARPSPSRTLQDVECRGGHHATRSNQSCRQRSSLHGISQRIHRTGHIVRATSYGSHRTGRIVHGPHRARRAVSRIHCGALIISHSGSELFRRAGQWVALCQERTCSLVFLSAMPGWLSSERTCSPPLRTAGSFGRRRRLRAVRDDPGARPSGAGELPPAQSALSRKCDLGCE
jgi:hypothetical protein